MVQVVTVLVIFSVFLLWIPEKSLELVEVNNFGTQETGPVEEDWGDGLKVLSIYKPELCEYRAKKNDIIHYHYVGRLASDGSEFGKSFDYNSPYIVALGHGRIIPGMDRGLMGTCLWERRRIQFPSHLGYGERGVGKSIPPNATLVFYIRLIKLERNGHVLGEDSDIVSIWNTGLTSYTDQNWEETIDMMEEALRLYEQYKKQTLICHKQCEHNGSSVFDKNRKLLEDFVNGDQLNQGIVHYSVKGTCLRECKSKTLPPQLRQPDPLLIQRFRRHEPYSFLQYSYYQTGQLELGAKSCFMFLHYNPTDEMTSANIAFYRYNLNLSSNVFIYRESALEEYQKPFLQARLVYEEEHWLRSTDLFEASLVLFKNSLEDCYLLCEDVVHMNMTTPNISPVKKDLLDEYGLGPNTREYYELLVMAIKEVLECQDQCYYQVAVIEAQYIPDYLSLHFDYLQYAYYKLGNIAKATESVATFLEIDPSNVAMSKNVRFYSSEYKLSSEDYVPRVEFVKLYQRHKMDERLLQFINKGTMIEKGVKGDIGEHPNDNHYHQEL